MEILLDRKSVEYIKSQSDEKSIHIVLNKVGSG